MSEPNTPSSPLPPVAPKPVEPELRRSFRVKTHLQAGRLFDSQNQGNANGFSIEEDDSD